MHYICMHEVASFLHLQQEPSSLLGAKTKKDTQYLMRQVKKCVHVHRHIYKSGILECVQIMTQKMYRA